MHFITIALVNGYFGWIFAPASNNRHQSSLNTYYNRMKRNEENKFKEYSPILLISCLVLSLLNTLGTFLCNTVLDVHMVQSDVKVMISNVA